MKRTYVFPLAVLASVFLMLAAACGSPDPTSTPIPAAGDPTPTAAPTGFQAEWDALIVAAQKEGKLVVAGGGGVAPMEPIYEIFTEKFDVKVVLGRGSSREHAERILAEQSAGRFTVDVAHSGANSANTRYIANGMAQPIEPFFMNPEVTDKSNYFGGRYWWTDAEEKYHFVMTSQITSPAGRTNWWWNTNAVSVDEIATWTDSFSILKDENKGKIVILSHLTGGATGGDLKDYLDPLIGPEWFERLYTEMDVFFTQDFNTLIDGLVFGRFDYGIELGSANTELEDIRNAGGPVERYRDVFEAGLVPGLAVTQTLNATGGAGGMLLLMRNLPHTAATTLYVNWILSAEGQQAIHDNIAPGDPPGQLHNRVSLRRGLDPGLTRPEARWVDGETYANIDMQPELRPLADQIYTWLGALETARAIVERPFDPAEYQDRVILQ